MATKRTDSPTIEFNLDTFEAESSSKPFTVVVGGKHYQLINAEDLDYRDLLQAEQQLHSGNPTEYFEKIVPEDKREEFFANRLSGRMLTALFHRYNAHFGLGEPGEDAGSRT